MIILIRRDSQNTVLYVKRKIAALLGNVSIVIFSFKIAECTDEFHIECARINKYHLEITYNRGEVLKI